MISGRSFGFFLAAAASAAFTSLSGVSAYDIGCIYPEMSTSDVFQLRNSVVFGYFAMVLPMETPYVVREAHEITFCQAACMAYHYPDMLDPITERDTIFTVPEFGANAYSLFMCSAQCIPYIRDLKPYKSKMMRKHGFDLQSPKDRMDIKTAALECVNNGGMDCMSSSACEELCSIMEDEDYHPFTVGHFVGAMVQDHFANDGWNKLGDKQYSRYSDEPVECTGSCRAYQDTTGYEPVADPRIHTYLSNDMSKYECTGNCRHWQPLQESDEQGVLLQQEHVAPHIGKMAKTYSRNATITLDDPEYDLYEDSLKVIEELRMTSSDQYKKDMIWLMDDKGRVRKCIQDSVYKYWGDTNKMSIEEYTLWIFGISTAEYDGLVQAWHEKVYHDVVRPTTYIKHWDNDTLYTYGGDRDADGPVEIAARDFEAFLRVMPHGEFPSGSACLCTAYMEFTDKFFELYYDDVLAPIDNVYHGGQFETMKELRDICSASRIWGGMHFEASIPAGEKICEGIGQTSLDYLQRIRNGAPIPGGGSYRNTPRPVCGEGGMM